MLDEKELPEYKTIIGGLGYGTCYACTACVCCFATPGIPDFEFFTAEVRFVQSFNID